LDGSFRPAFAVAAVVAATATVLATFVRSTPRQSAIRR
jgi:hypothetical protein